MTVLFIGTSHEEKDVYGISETTKAHATILEKLREDHSTQSGAIEQKIDI